MQNKNKKIFRLVLEFLGIFIVIFSLIFLVFNFQTLKSLVLYHFQKSVLKENFETLFDFDNEKEKLKGDDRIIIPKIFAAAPLIFSKTANEKIILENLKNGVVHFPKSKKPGRKGASIFLGHSSRPLLSAGEYDGIFLFLSKLSFSDEIFVYFKKKKFVYKVTRPQIISGNLSFLNFLNNKKQPTLYLITCWPPGTNLKRLVVEAELEKITNNQETITKKQSPRNNQ
jgi:LPXTG-site transpeptidase (sortase) family protein